MAWDAGQGREAFCDSVNAEEEVYQLLMIAFKGKHVLLGTVPMKCSSKHKIVIDAELIQPFVKISLIDQTASFVDYDKGENDPGYVKF